MSDPVPTTDRAVAGAGLDIRALVTHSGGPLLIEGPAGSGKTRLLLDRFRWFIEQGSIPERIAFVTPSRARADAVRTALEETLLDGYGELHVVTPVELAAAVLRDAGRPGLLDALLGPGERAAMLAERIDELPLQHHDFGGNAGALLARLVRRIDRLKARQVGPEELAARAEREQDPAELEFVEILRFHDRMLREAGAYDDGELTALALKLVREAPVTRRPFEQVLVDDAHELAPAAAVLVRTVAAGSLTAAGDPLLGSLERIATDGQRTVRLLESHRCPAQVLATAWTLGLGTVPAAEGPVGLGVAHGGVSFWRCPNERAQAQQVAAEIERLLARERVQPGRIAVLVPELSREGQAIAVALEERAVPHRIVGDVAFFQRAEVRDLLAWLRLLADPSDAAAVVRALARAPIELRSVDIARCTQIARRRKLDMVEALVAATESPQVPPEARERIRIFLKLYRACVAQVDTMRPDLYVHRLIERLGLRRQQLFAAQADVVDRLRALARFGEFAAAYVTRKPQATAREFARSIAAVAEYGIPEREEPDLSPEPDAVQVLRLGAAAGLEVDHAFVVGLRASLIPGGGPAADGDRAREQRRRLSRELYLAVSRARGHVVLSYPSSGDRGAAVAPLEQVELAREAAGLAWEDREEELFGPAETLHATYQLLRDELLQGTVRTGSRLAELRFDTDLDVSHAVVRYLELLKVSALITRDDGQSLSEALRDINARIAQAVTAEQREIFSSSPLDDYLLDAERDANRRAQVIATRDEPSLERFLPMRGDGVLLSATDIDTYRACPLKYKFARVFRIPQEPTLHQRFGIVVHQVLERYHASGEQLGPLAELLGLLEQGWRRAGFGDSEEERQLRSKATGALSRYHERAQEDDGSPVWFERQFSFRIGPHLVRGRVDRVDRLPGGEYELIDYKTGRPKSAEQLANDVQLSLYAIGAREAWGLEASRGAYYYLLDDRKVAVPGDAERADWIRQVALEVADGIRAQEFEPTPSVSACGICDYRLLCPAAER